ncbi:MAG: class I SAM-dependent rRNA methyltransferase [Acidobacteriota bacterium]
MTDAYRVTGSVRLHPRRDLAIRRGHPWVYRGSLAGPLPAGSGPVAVEAADGTRLGIALPGASGGSLALRMVARGEEPWHAETLRARVIAAAALRELLAIDSDAFRLVHAEGDDLSGLIVDRYGPMAVIEPFEPAWEPYLSDLAATLVGELGCRDVAVRRAFGADRRVVALTGSLPSSPLIIREGQVRFPVDVASGQKTGFFLDQRDNRRRVAELAAGARVLNLFSYSGGFAVAALVAGARAAINVDTSRDALALAAEACRLNGVNAAPESFRHGDAFEVARELVASGVHFDIVVVDPPAFVRRKSEMVSGLRGYKDINLQALRLTAPGGLLLTCSCSALVDDAAFGTMLAAAAGDAGRSVQLLERRGAAADHPVPLACQEIRHLKAWLCRVS